MLDKELADQLTDADGIGDHELRHKILNDKYGVDERIIALLSSEDARKAFNNLKPKNRK